MVKSMKSFLLHYNTDSDAKKRSARNYLVISKDRRVYLVWASEFSFMTLTALCDELLKNETGNFIIYVLVERNSDLCESLRAYYAHVRPMQIVVMNEHVKTFIEAADVVLTKLGAVTEIGLSDQFSAALPTERIEQVSIGTCREAFRRLPKTILSLAHSTGKESFHPDDPNYML